MLSKLWNWFKTKGWKYFLFSLIGYLAHLSIETFIVTQVLAKLGLEIPVLV